MSPSGRGLSQEMVVNKWYYISIECKGEWGRAVIVMLKKSNLAVRIRIEDMEKMI
jgi:hypothetical protein